MYAAHHTPYINPYQQAGVVGPPPPPQGYGPPPPQHYGGSIPPYQTQVSTYMYKQNTESYMQYIAPQYNVHTHTHDSIHNMQGFHSCIDKV